MVLSAGSISGDDVVNGSGESIGEVDELMIDTNTGEVGYAVLSFGGVMGMGNKLFAIPWDALQVDTENRRFVLDVPKERLEEAPGFDKDNWPDTQSEAWQQGVGNFWEQHRRARVG